MPWRNLRVLLTVIAFVVACKGNDKTAPVVPDRAKASAARVSSSEVPAPSASAAPSAEPAPAPVTARPFMWRVKKGEHVSWLFGTIHVGADAETQLNPVVWKHFAEAKAFAMECDASSVSPMEVAKLAMLPDGQTLDQKLSPASWKKLQELLGSGLVGLSLNHYRPWFAAALAEQKLAPAGTPMDLVFQKKAMSAKKQMLYFETVNEQIDMLDRAMTVEVLEDTLKEWDKAGRMMKGMIDAYVKGDVGEMEKLAFDPEDVKKHARMYELTLTKRNENWLPKLEKLCDAGDAFVAVGAGHLLGDKGLVAQLAKRGYEVERANASEP